MKKCHYNKQQDVVSNFIFMPNHSHLLPHSGAFLLAKTLLLILVLFQYENGNASAFFYYCAEVNNSHSEFYHLAKYLFLIWIRVTSTPRMTIRRFLPVAGAYGDL